MKKTISSLLILCLLLSLLSAALGETHLEGKPWVNPDLPGNLPDEQPKLENDFYLYVNYDLYKQAAEETNREDDFMSRVEKEMKDALWELVNHGDSTEAKALRILTTLIMDKDRREKDGLEPLMAYVRRVQAAQSLEEFSALCREPGFLFGSPYVTFDLAQSMEDPEKFVVDIVFNSVVPQKQVEEDQPQPETDEEWLDKKRTEEELLLLGWDKDSAKQMTERLTRYQLECVSGHMEVPTDENGNTIMPTAEEILNSCTPLHDQLVSQGMIPEGDNWESAFQMMDSSTFQYIQSQYREENLDLFKAIVCLSMYRYAVDYLDPATYAKTHEFFSDIDEKTAYEYMANHAQYLAEKAYADAYIPKDLRLQVMELTEECKRALADWMTHCEWLSEESRKNAAKKAEEMKVIIMTPEEPLDFEPLLKAIDVEGISLLQAAIQYDQTVRRFLLSLAGTPYARGHRFLVADSMLQADAVYNPGYNSFLMMGGILLPRFCDTSSRETLLATLGQTIAHEMSHGFDANSIQYNWEGKDPSPLTEEDLKKYQERAMRLVENLNGIQLTDDGISLEGSKKLIEETADLLGLRLVLDLAEKTEGFDYDLFFRRLARKLFRSFSTREEAMSNYEDDAHPPHFVRTNYTFAQFEEFYRTYPAVQEGTGMYYAPENRATLW